MFQFGVERLLNERELQAKLADKRLAFLGHPASVTQDLRHSLDALTALKKLKVVAAFGPQHGMRGDKQDNMIESDTRGSLPIHITFTDDRKLALETLYADEKYEAIPKAKAAAAATEVKDILAVGPLFGDIRALEIAVTGKADDTKTAARLLGQRAHTAVGPMLTTFNEVLDKIYTNASQELTRKVPYSSQQVVASHVGLSPDAKEALTLMINATGDLVTAATDLAAASADGELADDVKSAIKVNTRARAMLAYNWRTPDPIPPALSK